MRRLMGNLNRRRSDRRRAARLLDMSADLLGTIGPDGGFGELSEAFERELGYSPPELRAHKLFRLAHPDDRERLGDLLALAFDGEEVGEFEGRLLARDGRVVWVRWRWELEPEEPAFVYARGVVVTARRRMERERERLIAELSSQARSDPLTGIPNRRWLRDELAREVSRGHRKGTPFCVAMIELDDAEISDELLADAADRWRDGLRAVDFLARYDTDRLAVVLPDCGAQDARLVSERLRELAPDGHSCSIGIAEWDVGQAGDEVVGAALDALESARAGGGDRIVGATGPT